MTSPIKKLALFTSLFGMAVVTLPPALAFADDEKDISWRCLSQESNHSGAVGLTQVPVS